MRSLLESSWMRFGPAGRGTYDWVTRSPTPPSMEKKLQDQQWNQLSTGEELKPEAVLHIALPAATVFVLCLLTVLLYRRCFRTKLEISSIALDLQDAESSAEILSSRLASTSSDPSDGVFLMVYLPPPYQETLTKITRAASVCSARDAESVKIEDLEARLCPDIKPSGRLV
ncbi:small integral membrane protein 28 isoform X2 [Denticeps clupeoides]|uniref:small integral membrane protein 28 isoform X2 n=1 Tax=Denticeps clupeoides TaxID=299321 RepID=UPI0010A35EAD|nr:small integral membrane protein 28 isoform X2 [Denticeps clupeoides]